MQVADKPCEKKEARSKKREGVTMISEQVRRLPFCRGKQGVGPTGLREDDEPSPRTHMLQHPPVFPFNGFHRIGFQLFRQYFPGISFNFKMAAVTVISKRFQTPHNIILG